MIFDILPGHMNTALQITQAATLRDHLTSDPLMCCCVGHKTIMSRRIRCLQFCMEDKFSVCVTAHGDIERDGDTMGLSRDDTQHQGFSPGTMGSCQLQIIC